MSILALDGPSKTGAALTLTSAVVQIIGAGSPLSERKVVEVQPIDGKAYYYYGDGVNVPSAATVQTDGFLLFPKQIRVIEASDTQPIYVVAATANVDFRYTERG